MYIFGFAIVCLKFVFQKNSKIIVCNLSILNSNWKQAVTKRNGIRAMKAIAGKILCRL